MLDRALNSTVPSDSYYFSMRLIALRGPQTEPFTFKISITKGQQRSDSTKAVYNMEGTECSLNDQFLNFNMPAYNPNRPIEFNANMTDESLAPYSSFPITPSRLITEFINTGKNTFPETTKFNDQTYELEYVIYAEKSRGALLNLIRSTTEMQVTTPINSPVKGGDTTPVEKSPIQRTNLSRGKERGSEIKAPPVVVEPTPEPPADVKQSAKKSVTPKKIIERRNTPSESQVSRESVVEITKAESQLFTEPATSPLSKGGSRQPQTSASQSSRKKQPEPVVEAKPEPTPEPPVEEIKKPEPKKVEKIERSTEKVRKIQEPAPEPVVENTTAPVKEPEPPKKVVAKAQPAAKVTKPEPLAPKKAEPAPKKVQKPAQKPAEKVEKVTKTETKTQEPQGSKSKLIIAAIVIAAFVFGFLFFGGKKATDLSDFKKGRGKKNGKKNKN